MSRETDIMKSPNEFLFSFVWLSVKRADRVRSCVYYLPQRFSFMKCALQKNDWTFITVNEMATFAPIDLIFNFPPNDFWNKLLIYCLLLDQYLNRRFSTMLPCKTSRPSFHHFSLNVGITSTQKQYGGQLLHCILQSHVYLTWLILLFSSVVCLGSVLFALRQVCFCMVLRVRPLWT